MSFSKQDLIIFSINVLFIYSLLVCFYLQVLKIESMFIRDFGFSVLIVLVTFFIKKYLLKKENIE